MSAATPSPDALRLVPLDGWHRARGGQMVGFADHALPLHYTSNEGIIAEHRWVRDHAGLFDVSHMGQLTLTPRDGDMAHAEAAIAGLIPADLAIREGRMRYGLLLAADGGIIDDLIVTRWRDGFGLVVNGATQHTDITFLRAHLPEAIALDHHHDRALLALQGPAAADVLAGLGLAGAEGTTPPVTALGFMHAGAYRWGKVPLIISRSGYTGEDGFEIALPGEDAEAFAEALTAHPEVKPIGLAARDSLRLEAGLPLYGHDIDAGIDPITAGLAFAIGKRQRAAGGFHGAARILAAWRDGAARLRVGLVLDGRLAAREGAEIFAGEEKVGTVTSGCFAPSLGQAIAMGYVTRAHAMPGTVLAIDVRGRRLAARVTPLPFVPHRYYRSPTPQEPKA